MVPIKNLRELSFLVYGLGLTGKSVINFLKKIELIDTKSGMIKRKNYLSQKDLKILKKP